MLFGRDDITTSIYITGISELMRSQDAPNDLF